MSLRIAITALTALCSYHRVQLLKSYSWLQNRCFHAQFQRSMADVRNVESQNYLNLIITTWSKLLQEASIPEADLSVKYITEHVLGKERVRDSNVKENGQNLTREEASRINKMCHQRLKRIPVQYIIGEWDFRYLTLKMKPPVFIPRPETETTCVAIDKSKEAISLTRDNANRCCVSDRIILYHADVGSVLPLFGSRKFDAIISNPPYISEQDMAQLEPEVSRHEDVHALFGGHDGLDVIKEILRVSPAILKPESSVWLEVDISHPNLIQQWINSYELGLKYLATLDDFTQRPRFCHIVRK